MTEENATVENSTAIPQQLTKRHLLSLEWSNKDFLEGRKSMITQDPSELKNQMNKYEQNGSIPAFS